MSDLTSNGVEIHPGLRVFTTDYRWGLVIKADELEPGWYDVRLDGNTRSVTYNGERMTTVAPHGQPADPMPMRDDLAYVAMHTWLRETTVVGIVSADTVRQMLTDSTAPQTLTFTLA